MIGSRTHCPPVELTLPRARVRCVGVEVDTRRTERRGCSRISPEGYYPVMLLSRFPHAFKLDAAASRLSACFVTPASQTTHNQQGQPPAATFVILSSNFKWDRQMGSTPFPARFEEHLGNDNAIGFVMRELVGPQGFEPWTNGL